jgi:hypothetical protein
MNQRTRNPAVQISLLKKEGVPLLNGLLPFVQYKTLFFSLPSIKIKSVRLPPHITIVRVLRENVDVLDLLLKMLSTKGGRFEISIVGDLSHWIGLIRRGLLVVYLLKKRGEIFGYYFFRNDRVEWSNVVGLEGTSYVEGTSLSLVASWNRSGGELFFRGFLNVLREIIRQDASLKIFKIDELSDNSAILSRWRMRVPPFTVSENAYYFYNFIYPTMGTNHYSNMGAKCFILC